MATLRSTDHGQTWLPTDGPILGPEIKSINPADPTVGATDPDTGFLLNEFTAAIAFAAVDRHSGALYAVWEDSRFGQGQRPTDSSFDLQGAAIFFGGEFVGDSDGPATAGDDFVATWSMPAGIDQGNISFRRVGR